MPEKTALSLNRFIYAATQGYFRRQRHNKDVIIGVIGDRGGGKSVGAGLISVLDYGLEPGSVIRSNMDIQADIVVSDAEAQKGVQVKDKFYYCDKGGSVHYQSQDLDKGKFLGFDDSYKGAIYVIDEINIFLADARRSTSNQNLYSDDVGQQLRKWQSPLIYTCIHEMFVDSRIRDLTDIFIKSEDTAFTPTGLNRGQRPGIEFQWFVYAMTKKLNGERYADTKQKLGPYYIKGEKLWGIIDTNKRQKREKFNTASMNRPIEVSAEQDDRTIAFNEQFGWVAEKLMQLSGQGVTSLTAKEIAINFRGVPKQILKEYFGFVYDTYTQKWDFETFGIEREGGRHRPLAFI